MRVLTFNFNNMRKNKDIDGLRERPKEGKPLKNNHLESVLARLYPNVTDWIHDKPLVDENGKNYRFRPDFYSPSLKMVIEYDGASYNGINHYNDEETCSRDQRKDETYRCLGLKVVRIPMYVQLSPEMVKFYFGLNYTEELYPAARMHGFAHSNVCLPSGFCKSGLERFKREISELPNEVIDAVNLTLNQRIQEFIDEGFSRVDAALKVVPIEFLNEDYYVQIKASCSDFNK